MRSKLCLVPMMLMIVIVLFPLAGICEEDQGQKIITNTATVTYRTSDGKQVIVESAPGSNSIAGAGNGTPLILIIQEPKAPDHAEGNEK